MFGIAGLFGYAAIAHAEDPAARGEAIVDEWCRMCHQRATDTPNPDMAPPYEEIVLRHGRDEAYFVRFMQEDHFPMTTFRLFDHEKADVVAYLMALKSKAAGHTNDAPVKNRTFHHAERVPPNDGILLTKCLLPEVRHMGGR